MVAAPVGNSGFQADFYADKLGKSTRILELLPALHPHTAFLLLSQCVNARPAYLCRIVGPWSICGFLEAFDRQVDECLALIIGVQGRLPRVARILRGLPDKVGGVSVRRLVDVCSRAHAASFLKATERIRYQCPLIWNDAWRVGPEIFSLTAGLMSRVMPYFVGFEQEGPLWARPSTGADRVARQAGRA